MPYACLYLSSLVALTAAACVAALDRPAAESTVFYVSREGNDAWTGLRDAPSPERTDGPFATLVRARDAIRALSPDRRERNPITVYLRGGVYPLAEPLVLLPQDSGAEKHPVTYQAYPRERPVVSGGRIITGWRQAEGPIWKASVLGVKEGQWYFRQLFINGRRAQRARSPNKGFFQVEGEISMCPRASFTFRGTDINPAWADGGDVEVVALQAWAEIRMPIVAVDRSAQRVVLAGQCRRSNRETDARYWVENAPDALDSPGEWYLDRRTGEVSYWPLPGEDMTQAEAVAPALTQLVRLEADPAKGELVSNLRFQGLTFAHTDWSLAPTGYADRQAAYDIPAAFEANGAASVTIEDCAFTHLGGYGVAFARGCRNNRLFRNEMTNLGAGGIEIGEPVIRREEAEKTGGNDIRGNHIHDIGIVYPAAVGIWVGQSGGNGIRHNHIHDTYYSGISVGWTWGYGETNARDNIIEDNHVHDIGRGMLSDMGGVYTLGMQPGTVIRHNLFHDITSYGYGGWGIYLDEGSTQILVENNIVYNTKTGGFHQHYGRDNTIRNNIFAFSREGQVARTRMEEHLSFSLERNIVYWREGHLLDGNWSDNHYRLDSNLYFDASGGPIDFAGLSFAEWQARGQDLHSLVADPRFEDPDRDDFRLRPDSPALALGFQPMDIHLLRPQ